MWYLGKVSTSSLLCPCQGRSSASIQRRLLAVSTADEIGITVLLVNTVTGRIVHQQQHNGACAPVTAALFDNQAVLQFWDAQAFRWHVSALELYEHTASEPPRLAMISGVCPCGSNCPCGYCPRDACAVFERRGRVGGHACRA